MQSRVEVRKRSMLLLQHWLPKPLPNRADVTGSHARADLFNKISQWFGGMDDDSSYVQSVELFVDGGNVGSPEGGANFRSA
jgi:hypothetical protein